MMNTVHVKNKEKGFTLLEVMVTMLIVSIGLLAMAQLLITNIQNNRMNEVRMDSSAAIQSILEEATIAVVLPADCKASMTLGSASRQYLRANYTQTASCTEVLSNWPAAGGVQQQRYMISAQVLDGDGNVIKEGNTIITTAVSEL
jgi:prepilin-type N-terminal cleavage/methylation domain-containing protein